MKPATGVMVVITLVNAIGCGSTPDAARAGADDAAARAARSGAVFARLAVGGIT